MNSKMRERKPLVSIMIPNYNHARYLDECIKSALNQTYKNIEIIVLDNSSTDDSMSIASKYALQGVIVCRNQFNILNQNFNVLATQLIHGEYMMLLCADDYIYPTFIEKAVQIMERYPRVGYVHGERDFVTESGQKTVLDPFYKCSFVAPGRNTMPIYMMTTVAHPSQGVIRRAAFEATGGYDKEIDHMNADKTLWFYLSYDYDAAYIRDTMCAIRIGNQTETFVTQRNFQHPILCHLTIKDFVKFAKEKELPGVYEKEEAALKRLAQDFLLYTVGMISIEDWNTAEAYLTYAKVLSRKIVETDKYKKLQNMCSKKSSDIEILKKMTDLQEKKKRNYDPPEDYEELTWEEDL